MPTDSGGYSPSFTVVRTDRGFKRAPMCGQKGSAGVRRIRAGRPSQTRMRAIVRAFMQSSCAVRASADGDGWAGVVRSGTSVGGSVGVSVNSPRFHGAPMRSGGIPLRASARLEVFPLSSNKSVRSVGRAWGAHSVGTEWRRAWALWDVHSERRARVRTVRGTWQQQEQSERCACARALGGAARVLFPVSVVVSGVCGSSMSSMRAACAQAGMGMCD